MKARFLVFIAMVAFLVNPAFAEDKKGKDSQTYKPFECPKTHITDNDKCFNCHIVGNFKVKETPHDAVFSYPNYKTKIRIQNGQSFGYFYLTAIDDDAFRDAIDYFYLYGLKKVVIDIHSPGGGLFNAWRIKGIIDEAISNGINIQTRLYGLAASAGFLIFCAGQERVVHPQAEGMWHELITGEFLAIKTPSDKEDEALVLRHLQDTANTWISSKATISKDSLDEKIRKKEFWVNGKEMKEMGFATGVIGE